MRRAPGGGGLVVVDVGGGVDGVMAGVEEVLLAVGLCKIEVEEGVRRRDWRCLGAMLGAAMLQLRHFLFLTHWRLDSSM